MSRYAKYYGISALVLCLDQAIKLWVHHSMLPGAAGELRVLGDFFTLRYVSNPGMAFGVEFGIVHGKLILIFLRCVIICFVAYYLYHIVTHTYATMFRWCVSCMFGGALGNLIDGIFYGVLLGNAPADAPTPWLHGKVVDMFYIHIWEGRVPSGVPFLGGDHISLWPVFNLADASIFLSVCCVIAFRKKIMRNSPALLRLSSEPKESAQE